MPLYIVELPTTTDIRSQGAVEDVHPLVGLRAPVSSLATPVMYTVCPPPTGTDESKIALATSGRTPNFRECLASGDEIQWKL